MRIIYQQPDLPVYQQAGQLAVMLLSASVRRCYFKLLSSDKDSVGVLRRFHRHAGFEIHMILEGEEHYEAEGGEYRVQAGSYLVMPPQMLHRAVPTGLPARKCAITFSVESGETPQWLLPISGHCMMGRMTRDMEEAIRFILSEADSGQALSKVLIGNRIWEMLISIARAAGYRETAQSAEPPADDPRIQMARQYIRDNIARPLSCGEIAGYCHLSERQLTRLFRQYTGVSPAQYICRERAEHIEKLLDRQDMTLREISESLQFSSEYYFNAFMKKYAGMTPGAYRRMVAAGQSADRKK